MAIKKSLLVVGLLLPVATGNLYGSDEPNSAQPTHLKENPAGGTLQPAQAPPALLPAPEVPLKPAPANPAEAENSSGHPSLLRLPEASLKPLLTPPTTQQGVALTASTDAAGVAVEPGFRPLLQGDHLEGWTVQDGRSDVWTRSGNVISCRGIGGGWLRTTQKYSDFHAKFEYKLEPGGNTGFGIRTPDEGDPSIAGLEIQLIDDDAEKYNQLRPTQYSGSVYYQAAPQQRAKLHPIGEWNACEVICIGDELTVRINGETVNHLDLANGPLDAEGRSPENWRLAQRPPIGALALQSHSTPVEFRNLRIKDLTVPTNSGVRYVELADGTGESVKSEETSIVTVHYVGQLANGRRFTDTRDLGEAVTVPLDEVIPGWKHGLTGMKVGGKRRLIVPPEMGYGSQGVSNLIPPGSTLVFEVELRGIQR